MCVGLCSPLGSPLLKFGLLASPATVLSGLGLPGTWAPSVLYLWELKLELPQCADRTGPPALGGWGPSKGWQGHHTPSFWSASYLRFYLQ